MAANLKSKRAAIFERVLPFIETDDWCDEDGFIVFGKAAYFESIGAPPQRYVQLFEGAADPPTRKAVEEANAAIHELYGQAELRLRTKLTSSTAEGQHLAAMFRSRLSPEGWAALLKILEEIPEALAAIETSPTNEGELLLDQLDAAFTREILRKLDRVVARSAKLDESEAGAIHHKGLNLSWEEAHRCYLYGFRIASAILCRATLETALSSIIDPDGTREGEARQSGKGYIQVLIDLAQQTPVLQEMEPAWAREIVKAGNLAAHQPDEFEGRFSPEDVEELLIKTRSVIVALLTRR